MYFYWLVWWLRSRIQRYCPLVGQGNVALIFQQRYNRRGKILKSLLVYRIEKVHCWRNHDDRLILMIAMLIDNLRKLIPAYKTKHQSTTANHLAWENAQWFWSSMERRMYARSLYHSVLFRLYPRLLISKSAEVKLINILVSLTKDWKSNRTWNDNLPSVQRHKFDYQPELWLIQLSLNC